MSQLRQFELFPYMYAKSYRANNQIHFVINFAISEPHELVRNFFYELLAGLIEYLLKWQATKTTQVNHTRPIYHIKFPMPQPKHIEQFHSHLSCEYSFNHPVFMVSIPQKYLHFKRANALPALTYYHLKQSTNRYAKSGFKQFVSNMIASSPKATSEQIAQRIGMSCATLKRKLKQHNTSFKILKDEWQKQQSMIYIVERRYSNEQAAAALFFSDITNFRRSCKRWTGKTPSELRDCIQR
ncbi:helix-turn-helix domain-containing protein [Pseudoalteromonas sp. A25]|uniref:helix-turn-helix domain-containing protein n=1 Tax=Pseudoalteromonas sp. A25 TaxID=116092 RepID=UPI0015621AF6|nr:helix-turn-helix domain-containing protein [Pseudoalteromonas sp. A25]